MPAAPRRVRTGGQCRHLAAPGQVGRVIRRGCLAGRPGGGGVAGPHRLPAGSDRADCAGQRQLCAPLRHRASICRRQDHDRGGHPHHHRGPDVVRPGRRRRRHLAAGASDGRRLARPPTGRPRPPRATVVLRRQPAGGSTPHSRPGAGTVGGGLDTARERARTAPLGRAVSSTQQTASRAPGRPAVATEPTRPGRRVARRPPPGDRGGRSAVALPSSRLRPRPVARQ